MNPFATLINPPVDRPGVVHCVARRSRWAVRVSAANPWGLTACQALALSSLARVGCDKLVAREIGISHRTIETHVAAARKKMGAGNRTLAVLMWDRYARDAA